MLKRKSFVPYSNTSYAISTLVYHYLITCSNLNDITSMSYIEIEFVFRFALSSFSHLAAFYCEYCFIKQGLKPSVMYYGVCLHSHYYICTWLSQVNKAQHQRCIPCSAQVSATRLCYLVIIANIQHTLKNAFSIFCRIVTLCLCF